MELNLNLTAFQGPFDLLLHLIKRMEIDINDIPMREITQQYLKYIQSMSQLNLDVIGDYLVMAASLLEIKSRLLIPIEPEQMDDDEFNEDPRKVLVQQLLIYQQFQNVADALEEKQDQRSKIYSKTPSDLSHYQSFVPLEEGELTLSDLSHSMLQVLQRELERIPKERKIKHDQVSVTEKIHEIRQSFQKIPLGEKLEFNDLLSNPSRPEIIATFMALLELVRKQELIFQQTHNLGNIYIKYGQGVKPDDS
ncbi:segregation/condensation protein A [Facklamia sp. DSM 111018]|uniref:Segregation and condensation protein A n=3 Tax=Facklamia lactis TaxID=2749967 RepID=A0ABS0LNC3_9LACT|nr:segregation/condensation protein A [Facklamia lactis]MBG9985482.1 segregation/condensation protein A [Facklamia lactis]